jgi:hypothetical protein
MITAILQDQLDSGAEIFQSFNFGFSLTIGAGHRLGIRDVPFPILFDDCGEFWHLNL